MIKSFAHIRWGIGAAGLGLLLSLAACAAAPSQAAGASTQTAPAAADTPAPAPAETAAAPAQPSPAQPTAEPPVPSPTPPPAPTPTADTRPDPARWSEWPVIPTLSATARQIYEYGQAQGMHAQRFSSVGDCQSEPNVFMGIYATDRYWLGDQYQYLQETIDYFGEGFEHQSAAVRDGLSAPTALSPMWADKTLCQSDESPVACELRLYQPAFVFINLGTNWKAGASAARYEQYLRQIVDQVIRAGALPILSTKADNVEGDHSLNRATAQVAHDYDVPLWNFWLAAQSLENGGLDPERDNIYLSFPDGWDRRNFTALQSLDAIRRALFNLPQPAP